MHHMQSEQVTVYLAIGTEAVDVPGPERSTLPVCCGRLVFDAPDAAVRLQANLLIDLAYVEDFLSAIHGYSKGFLRSDQLHVVQQLGLGRDVPYQHFIRMCGRSGGQLLLHFIVDLFRGRCPLSYPLLNEALESSP